MENLIFKCPACEESITLMDVIGHERLANAITWVEQADIYEEWARAIRRFEIEHICK